MGGSRDIQNKIRSVENTKKITGAMEMVAASKMRKAQDRMKAARPYADRVRQVAANMAHGRTEYRHPFLVQREIKTVGLIVVTTDKGLCGGLNSNLLRMVTSKMKEWQEQKIDVKVAAIGSRGFSFMNRFNAKVVAAVSGLGDIPHMERLIGPVMEMIYLYNRGEIDCLHVCYNRFINTMSYEQVVEQCIPVSGKSLGTVEGNWDYIYEPDARDLIDTVMNRYIESIVYHTVTENIACEQSARMVAMKSASDNAGQVIKELKLDYNKARQAAITREISEIVGGAAAV